MASPLIADQLLAQFAHVHLLVVGDLIVDRYVQGAADRISPEAPVPVVAIHGEHCIPGGAANVARNLVTVGAQTTLVGVVGLDTAAETLASVLKEAGLGTLHLVPATDRPTTVKTRVLVNGQQMIRLDREQASPIDVSVEDALLETVKSLIKTVSAIILSDYGKGVLTKRVLEEILAMAKELGIPAFVDPKGRDYSKYRGCFSLTPNAKEAAAATGESTSQEAGLTRAAKILLDQTQAQEIVITRGPDGLALFQAGSQPLLLPTFAREVFDVTGAGDTFIAFLALGHSIKLPSANAAHLANTAAGVVVGKIGASTVSPDELRAAIAKDRRSSKTLNREQLLNTVQKLRAAGKRIALANGCFDFLHAGHVSMLHQAARLADFLIVATNSDQMITKLKGPGRPIIELEQRLELLAALESVDAAVVFDEETPHALIELLRPDVLVKGKNLAPHEVEGRELVESYGGTIAMLDMITDFNTSSIVGSKN